MDEILDDLAFLSDDIIHDVLQFAHFERLSEKSSFTFWIGGRWGKIAHKFYDFNLMGNVVIKSLESRLDGHSKFCDSAGVAVNSLCLTGRTCVNQIEHLVANAYESLEVHYKVIPKEFLENLGNRFTRIIWFSRNKNETNGENLFNYEQKKTISWREMQSQKRKKEIFQRVPMDGEIDFLTRQLKSPHLRILECDSPVLARPDFTDLLVDFVRKKNFQTLKSKSAEFLSFEVFLAAYEAWFQRSEREHLLSSITTPISTEDLRKLTFRIPNHSWNMRFDGLRTEWSYSEKHPTADHYEMLMIYEDNVNGQQLTMEFSRDSIKY